ncbi:CIR protein PIR protein [Plasmodium vinckei petteri]|uniref:CIR protein PIR protein n=1 Tax=Plasmodium vinckei petteri TaxID=138298 RepID=A0A6V7T5N7_PLAVN|nr:CIR protein PIR protein [Plasmodium vinckei petteri]
MSKSPYSIEDLYRDINTINGYFGEGDGGKGGRVEHFNNQIAQYCPYYSAFNDYYCMNYFQMARSGIIILLENLKKYNLEYDKLAEYAILFLSYKLKQHSEHKYKSAKLNDFYTNHIKNNNDYNKKIKGNGPTYKEIINKNKDLMNNNEISKFNGLFSILCKLYTECDKKKSYTNCSNDAHDFAKNFENLNQDSNINGNTSYRKLLSTLSNDYDNFKINFAEKCNGCSDLPTLPEIKTPPSKLIPVLSVFPVIPVFLGIAYKYSLFGVDKLFQRQYLRKKLKKITNKMKLNI